VCSGGVDGIGTEVGGAELAGAFHRDVVGPLLRRERPGLRYAAGRLGSGSDVLGLDDAMSRDHDWGLRLTVLVDEADRAAAAPVAELLERRLPDRFRGRPVRFATTWDPAVTHRVEVATVGDFAASRLGLNPLAGMSSLDWLVLTGQSVLEVIAGPVFADATTELGPLRRGLAWYPPDVERYVLACGWQRVAQRLAFVGRTAQTGQPLQSRLLSAELASDVISLAFALHRRWEPYEKWREALFTRLPGADDLGLLLETAVGADDWTRREAALAAAVEVLGGVQRAAGLPTPAAMSEQFFDRPYRTVPGTLAELLLAQIGDPLLARLTVRVGSVGQWIGSVDALAAPGWRAGLVALYRDSLSPGAGWGGGAGGAGGEIAHDS
jgi:Domain of unknown function (DUF4037)